MLWGIEQRTANHLRGRRCKSGGSKFVTWPAHTIFQTIIPSRVLTVGRFQFSFGQIGFRARMLSFCATEYVPQAASPVLLGTDTMRVTSLCVFPPSRHTLTQVRWKEAGLDRGTPTMSRKIPLFFGKTVVMLMCITLLFTGMALAQTDPGVRGGTVDSGKPFASVAGNANDLAFFQTGLAQFNEHQTVTGDNNGLGPRFNMDGCGSCHSQPAPGGTSPASAIFPNVGPNPQSQLIANGVVSGSTNTIQFFVTANGPVREARFPFFFNPDGTANLNAPNGGVEDLFTVSGRSDAGSCSLGQPSFNAASAANNIIFRIPTPVFGAGLMANIADSTLLINKANSNNNNVGVSGAFNHNGNDGTISRFGWKAQNKSLMIFAGEAYNVEIGSSNEVLTQDRPLPGEDQFRSGLPANCLNLAGNGYPDASPHSHGPNASTVTRTAELLFAFRPFLD